MYLKREVGVVFTELILPNVSHFLILHIWSEDRKKRGFKRLCFGDLDSLVFAWLLLVFKRFPQILINGQIFLRKCFDHVSDPLSSRRFEVFLQPSLLLLPSLSQR